jgi:hypothetical protein
MTFKVEGRGALSGKWLPCHDMANRPCEFPTLAQAVLWLNHFRARVRKNNLQGWFGPYRIKVTP